MARIAGFVFQLLATDSQLPLNHPQAGLTELSPGICESPSYLLQLLLRNGTTNCHRADFLWPDRSEFSGKPRRGRSGDRLAIANQVSGEFSFLELTGRGRRVGGGPLELSSAFARHRFPQVTVQDGSERKFKEYTLPRRAMNSLLGTSCSDGSTACKFATFYRRLCSCALDKARKGGLNCMKKRGSMRKYKEEVYKKRYTVTKAHKEEVFVKVRVRKKYMERVT